MYCKRCGAKLDDDARFCPKCGMAVDQPNAGASLNPDDPFSDIPDAASNANNPNAGAQQNQYQYGQGQQYQQAPPGGGYYQQPPYPYYQPQPNPNDAKSGGFAALCFFFPIVGLILFIVWHDTLPLRAKSCGKGALAGVITYVCIVIICYIIIFAFSCSLYSAAAATVGVLL